MDKEYSCFFTGHRLIAASKREWLERVLEKKIKNLIEDKGVVDFIAGGALGFDTMAANAVLKVKNEGYDINLHLYLPCYDNMKKWTKAQQYAGRMILAACPDTTVYVTQGPYEDGCMQRRNRKMADDARYCIAYCARRNSGTGATVAYAQAVNDDVDNLLEYEGIDDIEW